MFQAGTGTCVLFNLFEKADICKKYFFESPEIEKMDDNRNGKG